VDRSDLSTFSAAKDKQAIESKKKTTTMRIMEISIKISVTATHIANASPFPNSSPIALALRDMGYEKASVTFYQASFGGKGCPSCGARKGAGRNKVNSTSIRFSLSQENAPKVAKWQELGFKNKSDFINTCISVFMASLK
jgi:hypothetical protein